MIPVVFLTILGLAYLILVVSAVVVVVLDNHNPMRAMSWVVVLLFLPVVGLILYVFFGRNLRREHLIGKRTLSRISRKSLQAYIEQRSIQTPPAYSQLINLFRSLNKALPFEGNRTTLYFDGYTMVQALMRDISRARHHIHLEFYIFEDDAVGRLVRDLLVDKARQGVEVRLLYDDVGSWDVPNGFYDRMRSEGIEVRGFLKVRFPLFTSKVNYRNHRKVAVIDGRTGFIGGMNIAERYLKGLSFGAWRDTHLRIEGPAVYGLQSNFLLDWFFVENSLLTASKYYPASTLAGTALVQTVTSEPVGEWRAIMQGLVLAITSAKRYFYIQTPYFMPNEPILSALQTAALAGVDVRLMIPARSDSRLTHLGSMSYLEDVLKAGVKVFFYEKGFLHSKMMVSDDMLSTVGSTNMDFRSFEHNFEINAFVYDEQTAWYIKERFLLDQRDSRPVRLKEWRERPFGEKFKESVVRLLSPLL